MQTYSHAIITAALEKRFGGNSPIKVDKWALLAGSFMPDMPLFILTMIFFAGRASSGEGFDAGLFGQDYDTLYFTNPVWIIGHSLFHSPPMITLYLAIGYFWGVRGGKRWALALFWFAIGAGFHALLDIPTHHNDGPLLFFPFDWQTRFSSPISYWDPAYGARIFAPLEHLLDVLLLGFLLRPALTRLLRRGANPDSADPQATGD